MSGIATAWNTGLILIAELKGIACSKLPALGSLYRLINALEPAALVKECMKLCECH
jgi:hypothetical protein